MLSRSVKAGWPAAVIAVVVFLLFRNKAFNIDDLTFLTMAKHMLRDPLHPAAVTMVFSGRMPQRISMGMWSGPVMPAMLMPAVAAGGKEWLAHLVMLSVFVTGIFASAALALRLGVSKLGARWVAIIVATSPAVLALSMTNMPDIPAMTFTVLAAERLVAFRDNRRIGAAIGATFALALAVLSRQHVVLVFACMAPILLAVWPPTWRALRTQVFDRKFLATLVPMVAAAVLLVLAYLVMRDPKQHDVSYTLEKLPFQYAKLQIIRVNLANVPAQYVLTFPLGLAYAWLHGRRMTTSVWCWIGALVGVALAVWTQFEYDEWDWLIWQAPVTALGAAVLVDLFVEAWRRHDVVELGLAAWLLIALPVAIYPHLPPKYLVPCAPAMAILIMRSVERVKPARMWILGGLAAAGLVLSLLIIRADQNLGEVGRVGGDIVAEEIKATAGNPDTHVWFDGAWGFQWYAMQAGAKPMSKGRLVQKPGDIVVVGAQGWVLKSDNDFPNRTLLRRVTFEEPGGRILTRPAGFYSNAGWGPLPWIWSDEPLDAVEVWRID